MIIHPSTIIKRFPAAALIDPLSYIDNAECLPIIKQGTSLKQGTRIEVPAVAAEQDPLTILGANLFAWWRADTGITIDTGISDWADKSGNDHNLVQGTTSAQPTFVAADSNWNNQPSVSFDGGTDNMNSDEAAGIWSFLHDGTGCSIFAGMRFASLSTNAWLGGTATGGASTTGTAMFFGTGAPDSMLYRVSKGSSPIIINESGSASSIAVNTNYIVLFAYEEGRSGNEFVMRYGGTDEDSGNSAAAPSASDADNTFRLSGQPGSSSFEMNGTIPEVVIADIYPSESQLTDLDTYFNNRYGVQT